MIILTHKLEVVLVKNGVDVDHYQISRTISLPISLLEFRKKYQIIVGYFGAIAPWLWYEEINKLTKSRSDLGFVFIGTDYNNGLKKLILRENVLHLSAIPYKILPGYAKKFDICFIPFEPGPIAQTTSPLKLFEYFAMEKPVVATKDMLECTAYKEVFLANSAAEFSAAIDKAILVKDNKKFKASLRKLAKENSWNARAKEMEKIFL